LSPPLRRGSPRYMARAHPRQPLLRPAAGDLAPHGLPPGSARPARGGRRRRRREPAARLPLDRAPPPRAGARLGCPPHLSLFVERVPLRLHFHGAGGEPHWAGGPRPLPRRLRGTLSL